MNDHLHTSHSGALFIASFEGLRLRPYRDSVGVWTIGYGHTAGVGPRTTPLASAGAALDLLLHDLEWTYEPQVRRDVERPLTQHQFDAIVSLVYNVGGGSLVGSLFLHHLNAGHDARAANHFIDYDHAGGQVLLGLKRRRLAERRTFLAGSSAATRRIARTGVR